MKIGDLVLIKKDDVVARNSHEIGGMIVEFNTYNKYIGEYIIEWFDGVRTIEFDEDVQRYRNDFIEYYNLQIERR